MRRRRSIWVALAAAALMLLTTASAQAANPVQWTTAMSGTTANITAIAWPSQNNILEATASGAILQNTGSGFTTVLPGTAEGFNSIAVQGSTAIAVGDDGEIYRSTNGGTTWTTVPDPVALTNYCGQFSSTASASAPVSGTLFSVAFAGTAGTVYILGADNDILESTNSGASFTEINKTSGMDGSDYTVNCRVPLGAGDELTTQYWASANVGYLMSNDFGQTYTTTNFALGVNKGGSGPNGGSGTDVLAVDPDNPADQWAVSYPGGGASYITDTTNSGTTWNNPDFATGPGSLNDIAVGDDSSGKATVLTAGTQAGIWFSTDGTTFVYSPAAAPLNESSVTWNAVAVLQGTNEALVGGNGGDLVESQQDNGQPLVTNLSGSISGPSSLTPGEFGNYTVSGTDVSYGGGLSSSSYNWSATGTTTTYTGTSSATFSWATPGTYTITVTFTDANGNTGTVTYPVTVSTPTTTTTTTTPTPTPTPTTTTVITQSTKQSGSTVTVSATAKGSPIALVFLATPSKALSFRYYTTAKLAKYLSFTSGTTKVGYTVAKVGVGHGTLLMKLAQTENTLSMKFSIADLALTKAESKFLARHPTEKTMKFVLDFINKAGKTIKEKVSIKV